MEDKDKKNLKVLKSIRFKGEHIEAGSVIKKTMFDNKNDWLDLCCGKSPKLEQTADAVRDEPRTPNSEKKPAAKGKSKAAMPSG